MVSPSHIPAPPQIPMDGGGRGGWTALDGLKKCCFPKKGLHPFLHWTVSRMDGNFRLLDGNFRLLDGFRGYPMYPNLKKGLCFHKRYMSYFYLTCQYHPWVHHAHILGVLPSIRMECLDVYWHADIGQPQADPLQTIDRPTDSLSRAQSKANPG